ncbi:hypothetical protein ACW5R3_09750 [Bizionia sp. KMM 8389]
MIDFQNIKQLAVVGFLCVVVNMQAHTNPIPPHEHYLFEYDCDLCGCSTSSGSFGFGTLSNANFLGIRYMYQAFESIDGIYEDSPRTKETFNTYQLWAQIPVYKTFYVTATVPYQDLNRSYVDKDEHINGLGDINAIAWYKYQFNKKQKESEIGVDYNVDANEKSPHSVQFGLGIKFPTGDFEESLTDRVNPGFQVGTGSFDGIAAVGYNLGLDRFGLNTLFTYYLKGVNKNEYKFGNQFSYALNTFYMFPFTNFNVSPFVGISGDTYDSIEQYDETLPDTDGYIVNSSLGFEIAINNFIFGANYSLPVSQSLFGDNVESKRRFSVYLNYAL